MSMRRAPAGEACTASHSASLAACGMTDRQMDHDRRYLVAPRASQPKRDVAIAVEAAESMPPQQRKTAHRAVENELSAIDADIMARLGVRT